MLETLVHDEDGNLTSDGRWEYRWDAENRLRQMETTAEAVAAGVPRRRLTFTYDHQHRRVRKVVEDYASEGGNWEVTSDRRFVYDGWNLIGEFALNLTTFSLDLAATYTWGVDLSGTAQGAGGVGGLVSMTTYGADGAPLQTLVPCYDHNGNVTAYVDFASGVVTHRFEYDPFGRELTAAFAELSAATSTPPPFRFSTKYTDAETGLVYYGYRYYSPELGRWPSRDPIEERGGINLYGMVRNNPTNSVDVIGLAGREVRLLDARGTLKDDRTGFDVIIHHIFPRGDNTVQTTDVELEVWYTDGRYERDKRTVVDIWPFNIEEIGQHTDGRSEVKDQWAERYMADVCRWISRNTARVNSSSPNRVAPFTNKYPPGDDHDTIIPNYTTTAEIGPPQAYPSWQDAQDVQDAINGQPNQVDYGLDVTWDALANPKENFKKKGGLQ